jgi:hypothetical protein
MAVEITRMELSAAQLRENGGGKVGHGRGGVIPLRAAQ